MIRIKLSTFGKIVSNYLANVIGDKRVEDALRVDAQRAGRGKVLIILATVTISPFLRLEDILDIALIERVRPEDNGHGREPLVDAN